LSAGPVRQRARAAEEGLLEPLDYDIIDVSTFYPGLYTDTCVGGDVFSTVFAWNTDTYGDEGTAKLGGFLGPVEKFPGTAPIAARSPARWSPRLLADGVAPEDVYKS
jgi:putative spermidine/putrescine transport system substrate-binding protein